MSTTTTTTIKASKQVVPKLVCNITGAARTTTREYIDGVLARHGITEKTFLENYVAKGPMKMLRQDPTPGAIAGIRAKFQSKETHTLDQDAINLMLKYNGKSKGGQSGPVISPRAAAAAEAAKNKAAVNAPVANVAPPTPAATPKSTPTAAPKAAAVAAK